MSLNKTEKEAVDGELASADEVDVLRAQVVFLNKASESFRAEVAGQVKPVVQVDRGCDGMVSGRGEAL